MSSQVLSLLDFLSIIFFLTNLTSIGGPHKISRRAACGPRAAGRGLDSTGVPAPFP